MSVEHLQVSLGAECWVPTDDELGTEWLETE